MSLERHPMVDVLVVYDWLQPTARPYPEREPAMSDSRNALDSNISRPPVSALQGGSE